MPEEKFPYTSELSITEKALEKEAKRRNEAFPTFSQARAVEAAIDPEDSTEQIQTTEPDSPKGYTRGEFLHSIFWAAVGSSAAMVYDKYLDGKNDKEQADAAAEEIKFLLAQKEALGNQTSAMEEDIFHFITNSHELHLGGVMQLIGTYVIAHNNKDILMPPFITDNIDGQAIMFKRGVNILMMKEMGPLNIPYTQEGFHLYNLSALRMMSEARRSHLLAKILNELNRRYEGSLWNLNTYTSDSFSTKTVTLDKDEARAIREQTKNGNCACGPEDAIKTVLESIKNQW